MVVINVKLLRTGAFVNQWHQEYDKNIEMENILL